MTKQLKDPMDAAADMLGRRAYSSFDLSKKMVEKGYSKEVAQDTIDKLIEYGYLNDAEYAVRYTKILEERGKGNLYIKEKLKQSGIAEMPETGDELERALALLPKLEGKTPEQIGRRLLGLGFTPSVVYKILAKLR